MLQGMVDHGLGFSFLISIFPSFILITSYQIRMEVDVNKDISISNESLIHTHAFVDMENSIQTSVDKSICKRQEMIPLCLDIYCCI